MGDSRSKSTKCMSVSTSTASSSRCPIQAKGGSDRLSVVQTAQDIACCAEKFTGLTCRPIAAQFMSDDVIAMFELALDGEDVKLVEEKHYRLVPSDQIGPDDLRLYAKR